MIDPLSQLLGAIRLTGGIFLEARFTAPWCTTSHLTPQEVEAFLGTPGHIIAYHVVIAGRMVCIVDGEPPMEVAAGEVVLLPRNDAHLLASAPGVPVVSADDLIRPGEGGGLLQIDHGGGGDATSIVCGYLTTEHSPSLLIAGLPSLLRLDIGKGASRDWVEASVRFAARELVKGKMSALPMITRLSELLLVEAMRDYVASLDGARTGWLKGLNDAQIGHALTLIHSQVGAPWTIERLAHEVSMSRSAFNERFTALVGLPPIRYLTQWRLQLAQEKLRRGGQSITQIAHAIGYESEAAFNRAFKRSFGEPPARWRDQHSSSES